MENFPNLLPLALFLIPARYFIIAGIFYSVFYILKRDHWQHLKIQEEFPPRDLIRLEILYSLSTMIIFALVAVFIFEMYSWGYTSIYNRIEDFGMGYFIFSIFLFLLIHDFYFFVTHRMMHHKKFYPIVHRVHHLSLNPTPWAAFSFHPVEAFIQIAWIPVVILFFPVHHFTIMIWALYMMLFNVIGHLGYEFFPRWYMNSILGRYYFSSTFHNMHHSKNNCNYGLYFIIWDRVFNTIHPEYKNQYDRIRRDYVPE